MVRKMTLAGVLALLPVAACSPAADDANLEAKAEQAEKEVTEAAETTEVTETAEKPMAEHGPALGEALPVSSLVGVDGSDITLTNLVGDKGGVIVFSRSAEWCPYCQKQMVELKDAQASLDALGMKLTIVTYDTPEILKGFAAQHELGFQFASDTDSTTIKALNLLNAEMPAGTKYFGVPHPATIVLDASGNVQKARVDTDYKIRPTNEDVIAMATEVAG